MSGAQSWSVKGIDPKVREAAREAAARQGLSLGEYLNQALAKQHGGAPPSAAQSTPPIAPRVRTTNRFTAAHESDGDGDDDWSVGSPSLSRGGDPSRLSQRVEAIERRTQLAVTGLDRAVSTIDRSVMGLAARIDDAESVAQEAADRIADALEQFRIAGETLSGRLERAEYETIESRKALNSAHGELSGVKERLEQQVVVAEEVARRAEAAASYLTTELENRDISAKQALSQTLAQARAVAEEAARQATQASADAVAELRELQEALSERLTESEASTRRAISEAVQEVDTTAVREALLEEVVRLEGEIAKRVGSVDELRSEHAALISRIERAEAGAREATAGLRQAAGAAIADLRNSQLTLSARLKQVEDVAGASGAIDLTDLRHAQSDIAERLAALEASETSPVTEALAAFEQRIAEIENGGAVQRLDNTIQRLASRISETESTANTAIRTLEETVSALSARVESGGAVQETEAVRAMLEQRLDTMAQSVSHMVVEAREELAGQLAAALEGVTSEGMEGALADVNRRLAAAERRQAQTIEAISLEIRRMSESVDKRLRTVETRNDDAAASAVREELSRMATTLEHRFDEIERREAAAFDRMGLEVGRLSERLEDRVGAVEQRSAQAIEHVGEQVARMADRFNQRHEVLARDLGERMIDSEERAGARVAEAISSIMHRLAEVEERSAEAIAPVQKAVSSVATKLEHLEHGSRGDDDVIPTPSRRTEDLSFPQSFSEPEPYVSPRDAAQPLRAGPLPPRAQAPTLSLTENEHDIYFAEDASDDLIAGDGDDDLPPFETSTFDAPENTADQTAAHSIDFGDVTEETALFEGDDLVIEDELDIIDNTSVAPPPADDDPFWTPELDNEFAPSTATTPADDDLYLDTAEETATFDVPLAPTETQLSDVPLANEPAPPPGKNDYLANARKAAQAQSLPKTSTRKDEGETPKLSLRGSSRVVLWAGTGLVAAALMAGLYYVTRAEAPTANVEPEAEPTHVLPGATDPAPYAAPVQDPFAEAPVEGATATAPEGSPTATDTPLAQAAPVAPAATTQVASGPVVAGPLAPRSQSLEQAAQSGNLVAQYELALQRIGAGRTADGVTLMRRAADRGLAMAQYRMAKIYERGEGVPTDLNVARQWTERAAAGGNRRAMHDLGVYFARGEGAPLDEAAAFRWFRQAAELGVADSQYNLGVLYQQGRGVNASPGEALFWFLVAARQGDQDAATRATALEGQLAPIQVDQARARSQAFRPRAASAAANGEFGPRPWARTGT